MTIHHMRDYSANPKTAANNVYPPEAPMFEDVPEDWIEDDPLATVKTGALALICGVLGAALIIWALSDWVRI